MTNLIGEEDTNTLKTYFPELDLYNSQYSTVMYTDTEEDSENITNLDNNTGYLFNNTYVPSGHFKRLDEMSKAVRGTYSNGAMHCVALSDDDYNFLADGSSVDLTDSSGMGCDFYKHVPSHWYKGVNDFKNQVKYGFRSICKERPIATYQKITRKKLSEILVESNSALALSDNIVGHPPIATLNVNTNVYEIGVQGMKQVRWPGINSPDFGCLFIDADGNIISQFKMAVSDAQFDFITGEDYIFTDVPAGSVRFMFTSQSGCDEMESIAVDSDAVEAIEPDWVFCKEFLVGIYKLSKDGFGRARSISGNSYLRGDGINGTSALWTYDSTGKVTNLTPPSGLHYTVQDQVNLCAIRGAGFHAIDYEQSKNLANIIMELTGTRDIQALCGTGLSGEFICGAQTIAGKNINAWGNRTLANTANSVGNLMFGIQNFVGGAAYEVMAHIAVNVLSYKDWRKKSYPSANQSGYPTDCRWHIYDCINDTERSVQASTNESRYCISRLRFGRFMDTVPGKCSSDNKLWNKHYASEYTFNKQQCRIVFRGGYNNDVKSGLVCANTDYHSDNSYTHPIGISTRLAFSGVIVFNYE